MKVFVIVISAILFMPVFGWAQTMSSIGFPNNETMIRATEIIKELAGHDPSNLNNEAVREYSKRIGRVQEAIMMHDDLPESIQEILIMKEAWKEEAKIGSPRVTATHLNETNKYLTLLKERLVKDTEKLKDAGHSPKFAKEMTSDGVDQMIQKRMRQGESRVEAQKNTLEIYGLAYLNKKAPSLVELYTGESVAKQARSVTNKLKATGSYLNESSTKVTGGINAVAESAPGSVR